MEALRYAHKDCSRNRYNFQPTPPYLGGSSNGLE